MEKIDLVIPTVDSTDQVWRTMYTDYCKRFGLMNKYVEMNSDRYVDNMRLIDYQLKLVNKNMPWVNKIFLLLSNREQAPKDLPSNVEIVYHARFIPQRFLPTFNSTTIEMFLWNIPNLGEYFIYANDDMLPLKPLKPSDFFENGKIKLEWWYEKTNELFNVFRCQCYNSYAHLLDKMGIMHERNTYMRPAHTMTPMIKSHCAMAFNLLKPQIEKHIRAFRTEYQYNQYIYPIFERFRYGTIDSTIDFLYTQCSEELDLDHDIVCFNIVPNKKVNELKERLDKLL